MRKVILGLAVSVDGFIEGPNGEYDWCFTDQDYGLSHFLKGIDTLFIGRKTYELILSAGNKAGTGFPKMKEYIFSTTLKRVKDGATLISGDIKSQVDSIKKEKGKDIWLFGGASLTTSLMTQNLVDELWLSVHPILLSSGKPLFQQLTKRLSLKLLESKSYSSGLVSLKYSIINNNT